MREYHAVEIRPQLWVKKFYQQIQHEVMEKSL